MLLYLPYFLGLKPLLYRNYENYRGDNDHSDLFPAFRARVPRGLGGYAPLRALLDYDPR